MRDDTLIKLGAIALSSWLAFGHIYESGKSYSTYSILILILAILDAGNQMQQAGHASGAEFARRFFALKGAPFYLALLVLVFVSVDLEALDSSTQIPQNSHASMCGAEGRGCGSSGGCGSGGCGASSGGACGCGGGKKSAKPAAANSVAQKSAPQQPLSKEELRQRALEVQNRKMASGSTPLLPHGLSAEARPLPPRLVPKADAPLPAEDSAPSAPPERSNQAPSTLSSPAPPAQPAATNPVGNKPELPMPASSENAGR
jgi:hypothetical protein